MHVEADEVNASLSLVDRRRAQQAVVDDSPPRVVLGPRPAHAQACSNACTKNGLGVAVRQHMQRVDYARAADRPSSPGDSTTRATVAHNVRKGTGFLR